MKKDHLIQLPSTRLWRKLVLTYFHDNQYYYFKNGLVWGSIDVMIVKKIHNQLLIMMNVSRSIVAGFAVNYGTFS